MQIYHYNVDTDLHVCIPPWQVCSYCWFGSHMWHVVTACYIHGTLELDCGQPNYSLPIVSVINVFTAVSNHRSHASSCV